MTAPKPQQYSIEEEKNREESEGREERQQESLHERIDAAVFELYSLAGSLGTVGELMLGADVKCDSVAVGAIIDHYISLIYDSLGSIEGFLTDDMRRAN